MYRKFLLLVTSLLILEFFMGCQKNSLDADLTKTEVKVITPEIVDLRAESRQIDEFVNSVLRSTNSVNRFSAEKYDLSKSESLKTKSGIEVYSSKSKEKGSEHLIVMKKEKHIQSVSLIRILEDLDDRVTMEYVSAHSGDIIFSGYLDKKTKLFHVTYFDESLKGDELRASVEGLLCNLGVFGAGASWSYAVGLVSGGAGFAVGLAFTVASYYICDSVK